MKKAGIRVLTIAIGIVGIFLIISLSMLLKPAKADSNIITNSQNTFIELTEGKNYLSFYQPLFVKDFMRKNPDIEALSYFDSNQNKTIGYIRALGGIGKNFIIIPGQEYEIIASKNTTISVD
jgi:hypothetical protein